MKSKSLRLILVLFAFIVMSLVTACQPKNAAPATHLPEQAPTTLPTATLEPTPDTDEVRRAIINALLSFYSKSNRMDVTTILEDGQTHRTVIEFVPPDQKRIVADGTEIIVTNGKVFVKNDGATGWEENQTPASTYLGAPVTEQSLEAMLEEVEFVRSDMLDGQPMKLYRYRSTTKSGDFELHSQTVLWVGQVDGLPYMMVVDGETLAVSNDPATGENKVRAVNAQTTTLIVFDPSLHIESPMP
jgi:hypothetical protein